MADKLIRKLTIATAFGDKLALLKAAETGRPSPEAEVGTPVDILEVVGRVSAMKPGTTKRTLPTGEEVSSDFVKLMGEFEATNLLTGEVTQNDVCILPNFVSGMMAQAIKGGAQAVDFAIKLQVRFKLSAATMYEFTAESLIPIQQAKTVAGIKAQILARGLALPSAKFAQIANNPSGEAQTIGAADVGKADAEAGNAAPATGAAAAPAPAKGGKQKQAA